MQKTYSLLLIEDDPMLGRLYESLLEDDGYDVTWHQSAVTAIHAVQSEQFDLILLDIMLPEMSGLEALDKLGSKSKKTVMLTNLDHARILDEVQRKGTLGYIIKSDHTPESFLTTVSDFLSQLSSLST